MKKNLFIATLLCSISFAGKAATNETKATATAKKAATIVTVATPTRVKLYEMTFDCPKQGWSIPVVGYTAQEMANTYMFYQTNLDC